MFSGKCHLERDQRAVALADRRGSDEFSAGDIARLALAIPMTT